MTTRIPLSDGAVALVDDGDADLLLPYRWFPSRTGHLVYATARDAGGRHISMHRLVLGFGPDDLDIDHKDRDGLNNQRDNLRPCTRSQNMANRTVSRAPKWSRFKGVTRAKTQGRWFAQIGVRGLSIRLGTHHSEEEAARAYDHEARRYFGEFARTNLEMGLFAEEPTLAQMKARALGVMGAGLTARVKSA